MSATLTAGPTPHQAWLRRRIDRRAQVMIALAALLGMAFGVLALVLRRDAGTTVDIAITHAVQRLDDPLITSIMVAISAIGYAPWSWLILGLATLGLLSRGLYREVPFVLASEGAGMLTASLKLLVERPRPSADLVRVISDLADYSFPSGHVVGYVSLYGFLFFLVYVRFVRSWQRTGALVILGLLIGLIGVSRMYLGHHWAGDVLGGYALGTAYLLLLVVAYRLIVIRPSAG